MSDKTFRTRVVTVVSDIPSGKVMTYGQIAAMCGNARAARIVGGIAHYGDPVLPWHRVVNKSGGLASGYPGGRKAHKRHLEAEGTPLVDDCVDMEQALWHPIKQ